MKYRYSFQDIQAAAQHNWGYILARLGVPEKSLRDKHQPCPMCGGENRYRYDDKGGNGTYFCNKCGAGNGFIFVQKFLNLNTRGNAIAVVAQVLGMGETGDHTPQIPTPPKRETPPPKPEKDQINSILRIWESAVSIVGTPAEMYLRGRGIHSIPHSDNLRFHAHLPYYHNGKVLGEYAALIGLICDTSGEPQGIQRIYLAQDNTGKWGKAKIHDPQTGEPLDPKKQMTRLSGSTSGAAIHIMPPENGFIVLAEGIETAIAARELFGDKYPIWATVNANNMKHFKLPENIKSMLIVADNDRSETGFKAAHDLAVNAIKRQIRVQIWQPEMVGYDALDELNRRKTRAYQIMKNALQGKGESDFINNPFLYE